VVRGTQLEQGTTSTVIVNTPAMLPRDQARTPLRARAKPNLDSLGLPRTERVFGFKGRGRSLGHRGTRLRWS
jgi:hypothetical protein